MSTADDLTAARLQFEELRDTWQGLQDSKLALKVYLQENNGYFEIEPTSDPWAVEEQLLVQQMNNLAALISSYEDQQAALRMLDQEEASQAASLQLASALSAQEAWDADVQRPHDAALARALLQCNHWEWEERGDLIEHPLDLSARPKEPVVAVTQTSCSSAQHSSATTDAIPSAFHEDSSSFFSGVAQHSSATADDFPSAFHHGSSSFFFSGVAVVCEQEADVGASSSTASFASCRTSAQRASAGTSRGPAADRQAHVDQGPQQLCNICFDSFPISKMMAARLPPQQACSSSAAGRCGHLFCCSCMREYVKCEVQARKHPICCPDPSCSEKVEVEDVMQLLIQDTRELQIYESVVAEQLIGADRCVYCPYKDCSELLERPDPDEEEGEADGQEAPFECPCCKRTFCVSCGITGWHHGLTCQQFQALPPELRSAEDAAVLQVAQQKQWKRCPAPGCGHLVERTEGCNHMRCRCGNDFCYACGALYKSTEPTAGNEHGSPSCTCPLFPVPEEEPDRPAAVQPVVLHQAGRRRPWRNGRQVSRTRCRHSASIYDCPQGPRRCWFWHDEDDDE